MFVNFSLASYEVVTWIMRRETTSTGCMGELYDY